MGKEIKKCLIISGAPESEIEYYTVSYTHLDVYKRQGHACQHAQGYAPLKLRNAVIPMTRIGSFLGVRCV